MNFILSAVVALSAIFASAHGAADVKRDFNIDSSSSSSSSFYDSSSSSSSSSYAPSYSSSSSSSSSYSSSYSSGNTRSECAKALSDILEQAPSPAKLYFQSLEQKIKAQAALWLNPATRADTAALFAKQYGVGVNMADAFGKIIYGLSPFSYVQFPETAKSWALNNAAIGRANTYTFYSFHLWDKNTGEFLDIGLDQTNSKLPLNQYCFRKAGLNRLN